MKAYASIAGGICSFTERHDIEYIDVSAMSLVPKDSVHLMCGALDDWESIQGPTKDAILNMITARRNRVRVALNVETCLLGASNNLQRDLLEECEDLIAASGGRNELTALLLKAPLAKVEPLQHLLERSLSSGFGALADILEEVRESQPALRRVVDKWMALPDELFLSIGAGRAHVWRLAVQRAVVYKTIYASTFSEVESVWAPLLFEGSQPSERKALANIASALALALFPGHQFSRYVALEHEGVELHENETRNDSEEQRRVDGRLRYQRALKQISAVTTAVARGQDAKAKVYLDALIDAQIRDGDMEHAVKSLCNVAQRCAEMFRTDFEYECLQRALQLDTYDGYLLIQVADHFKRVGRFQDALSTLDRAQGFSNELVRQSSIADVYTGMGSFQTAIEIYERLDAEMPDDRVRGAKADVLRRWGRLDAAKNEYRRLIEQGYGSHRVIAGLAEIAKRQGNFEEARTLYEEVLTASLEEPERVIYQTALANVLVRMGWFGKAYQYLDEVVQLRPFAFHVRAQRAAVVGLLGRAEEAIQELPDLGQTHAFDEWVNSYVRGLLLLMLDRYADAREALLNRMQSELLDKESREIVRLGAAVWFLRTSGGVENANLLLAESSPLDDAFSHVVRTALQYHVAVAQRSTAAIERLRAQLTEIHDQDVENLVQAIDRRNWKQAWHLEVKAVLRLAA